LIIKILIYRTPLNSNLFCQAPIADFSYNPNGCVGVAHNFTDISANAPNSFYWTFGDGGSSTNQNTSNVYANAGTYLVTFVAINVSGSDTIAYNVTIYDNPIINAGTDQTICEGSSIALSASGGFTYNWTPSSGLSSSTVANPMASPATTTTYTVMATDTTGCSGNDTITINVNLTPILSNTKSDISCFGNVDGQIDLLVSSGTPPYLYSWASGPTTQDLTSLAAGTYSVTVIDSNGCTNTLNETINEPALLSISISSYSISCFGANDGYITTNVTGGTGTPSYLWSNFETTQDIYSLSAGTYSVTVTDSNFCTVIDSVTVIEPVAGGIINGFVYYQTLPITSGVAELIRKDGNLPTDMTLVQTVNINPTSGEFIFFALPAANYIIKVLGDTTMYNCAATYPNLTSQWQLAQEFTIASSCFDSVYVDIDLIELPINSGNGTINGRLVESGGGLFNKAPGEPIPDIDITIDQSPGGTIMAATTTDSLGYFTVTNLPIGTYIVYADMFGYGMDISQTIDLNGVDTAYNVVLCSNDTIDMIDMCEMSVVSVKKVTTTNKLSVYPNPAKDLLNIVYNGNEVLHLEITDITGKKIMNQTLKTNTKSIDVANLSRGLYLVRLYNQHDDFIQKLVIE
jgi:PKD repeat protein